MPNWLASKLACTCSSCNSGDESDSGHMSGCTLAGHAGYALIENCNLQTGKAAKAKNQTTRSRLKASENVETGRNGIGTNRYPIFNKTPMEIVFNIILAVSGCEGQCWSAHAPGYPRFSGPECVTQRTFRQKSSETSVEVDSNQTWSAFKIPFKKHSLHEKYEKHTCFKWLLGTSWASKLNMNLVATTTKSKV